MTIKVFNTLTGKKEVLKKPKGDEPIRLFVCGQTVYDHAHLGHARTYLVFDTIVRYLRSEGYLVTYAQNITDIDDKIIDRAKEKNIKFNELAEIYIKAYLEDAKTLGIQSVDLYPRASDFIPKIIDQVKTLLEKGFAYETSSGIYFEVRKFKKYGKLSGQKLEALRPGYRIEPDPEKKDLLDFALWKFRNEEPFWESPWGNGRPGWHIEDTAITNKIFGPQYEIHGGAVELKFPHHEAEIAQQESASGKSPLVKIWIHTGLLLINGEKMSKSLKNFITIRDFLKKWPANVLRWIVLSHHYSSPIDYKENLAKESLKNLEKITDFMSRLNLKRNEGELGSLIKTLIKNIDKEFNNAMSDNFNTPKAIASLFNLIIEVEKKIWDMNLNETENVKNFINKKLEILGIKVEPQSIPHKIYKLAEERDGLRLQKKFSEADARRKIIKDLGYEVEDTPLGPHVRKISI